MGSLQDQLLKVGLIDEQKIDQVEQQKKARREQRKSLHHAGRHKAGKKALAKRTSPAGAASTRSGKKSTAKKVSQHESDLAAAYHAKQKAEKQDKEHQKQQRMAEMERRRIRNLQLDKIVEDKVLNDEKAELPRYFNYMKKIRRILLTQEQLEAVNAGDLVILVHRSRPALVDKETATQFAEIAPDLLPDIAGDEPDGADWDDQYAGFEVPDDLRW